MTTISDYVQQNIAGVVNVLASVWVKITNNAGGSSYVSTSVTDGNGLFTINNVLPGVYTVATGPTAIGPWTNTGDNNYVVAPIYDTVQTPAFVTPLVVDASAGQTIQVGTLTGNITIGVPLNSTLGQKLTYQFTQDGTGSRTVTWNAVFKTSWKPSPTANKISSVTFWYDGTNWQQFVGASVDDAGNITSPGAIVGSSFTANPNAPYTATAASAGADYGGPVRFGGAGDPFISASHPKYGFDFTGGIDNAAILQTFINDCQNAKCEGRFPPNATIKGNSGVTIDVSKLRRLTGVRTVWDFSGMAGAATAVAFISTVTNLTGSYNLRSGAPVTEGIEIKGPGKASTVNGCSFSAAGSNEIAHTEFRFVVHDFASGILFGNGAHNLKFFVDVYNCNRCIDDTLGSANAGEQLAFMPGSTFFNSNMAGYFRNAPATYSFTACSFDYNQAVFDSTSVITCTSCHTEGNDANYGTRYPFVIGGNGTLDYVGGTLTGALTTVPGYVNTTATTARAAFRETIISTWGTVPFSTGTGSVLRTNAQTLADTGNVYSVGNQSVATGVVGAVIPLGAKGWDTSAVGNFWAAGQPNRITASQAGFYLLTVGIEFPAVAGGTVRQIWAARNGVTGNRLCYKNYPINTLVQDVISQVVYCATGDYFELQAYQDSGGALTITADAGTGSGLGTTLYPSLTLLRVS
jgi:hypothetical protein